MAEASSNLSKTAKKSTQVKAVKKRMCPKCLKGETIVVKYMGYGPLRGFRWTCQETACGFTEPTRG
jgi:hypothetical protein